MEDKKTEKQRKKELKRQWQEQQQKQFEDSLPMSRDQFKQLFDCLDAYLKKQCCDHSTRHTLKTIVEMKLENNEAIIQWMREHGGYCDCEVLWNVEEYFD